MAMNFSSASFQAVPVLFFQPVRCVSTTGEKGKECADSIRMRDERVKEKNEDQIIITLQINEGKRQRFLFSGATTIATLYDLKQLSSLRDVIIMEIMIIMMMTD